MRSVLCGVDGSDEARAALALARRLAARLDARLVVAHVVSPPPPPAAPMAGWTPTRNVPEDYDVALRAGRRFLDDLLAGEAPGARGRCELGPPADELVRVAREEGAELLVVGSRGRGPLLGAVLGSVSSVLACHAPCPVAIVPLRAARSVGDDFGTIVCGVDREAGSRAAVHAAHVLAERLGSKLVLAHVAPVAVPGTSAAPGAAATLRQLELRAAERLLDEVAADEGLERPPDVRIVFGPAAHSLASLADEEGAALVVVGTRGRGAFKSAILGSVSRDLVAASTHPVVVVPPAAAASRAA